MLSEQLQNFARFNVPFGLFFRIEQIAIDFEFKSATGTGDKSKCLDNVLVIS